MQAATSTIAKFSRSFIIEHTKSERVENVKEKMAYSEFQAFGEPFASLGIVGDIYVDITNKNSALYARFEGGWKKWPGPTQRTTPLHHPVHLTHVLWCKLDKKVLGWMPVKSLSRILVSSSSHVISAILDARHSALQKHVKKQSKNHTLPPPTKKPRLNESPLSSAQADSTDPVRNSLISYRFSFPPFVDSTVTFVDKPASNAMGLCTSDSKPQSDAQHNATREARRASKHMVAQNMQTNGLPELDDDFMAESQRIMNAIMSSTKDCAAKAGVVDARIHETQLPNPPLKEPPTPRVPSPSCPQTQTQRSNSSGSSSTLSGSGPVIPLANTEPTTREPPAKLPDSPIPVVKKEMVSPGTRKRSSWAMLDEEMHQVGASLSAPQLNPVPTSGNELEHFKASSSFSIATSVPLRKISSPPKLDASFSSPSLKAKGKAKATDGSFTPSTPISIKEELPPSAEVANQVLSSGSDLPPCIFDDMQPESPLAARERQTMPTSSSSDRWKQLQQLPPARLDSSSASPSTSNSTSSSRSAVRHSKSDLTGAASKHMPQRSVQKPALVNSLDTSASPTSLSTNSLAREGKAINGRTAIQAVRKRSPSPMNAKLVEEKDDRGLTYGEDWPLPTDDEPLNPSSRSPSASANIKLEKRTPPSSPVPRPKKSHKAAASVSAPAVLANKRLGKGLASSVSARTYPKQSRVVSDKSLLDLTGVDSDDDDVIEITPDGKVKKYSSVIMSPTKFKVKGRDPPMSFARKKLKVMPKHKRHSDYKRKATAEREAKAKQQLQNELNMESVIDLTLASDEDEDEEIIVRPLLLVKKTVPCEDEIEKQAISIVKEEKVFGDIEMVDLATPSHHNVEEIDAGFGGDVDMSNTDDINDGMSLAGDEVNKDEDDKNDYDDEDGGLPIGSEDVQEDGRNDNSTEEEREFSGREDDGELQDIVPPLAHLPEPQSDSETESSHTATDEQVDELKDEGDESEHELENGEDLSDTSNLQLTHVHLRLLFDLDGKRYCRACLSHEPTVYWQVPPGSVELVSEQLMRHCISVHLQICEQFAALDHDELREIETTVM